MGMYTFGNRLARSKPGPAHAPEVEYTLLGDDVVERAPPPIRVRASARSCRAAARVHAGVRTRLSADDPRTACKREYSHDRLEHTHEDGEEGTCCGPGRTEVSAVETERSAGVVGPVKKYAPLSEVM